MCNEDEEIEKFIRQSEPDLSRTNEEHYNRHDIFMKYHVSCRPMCHNTDLSTQQTA